MDDQNFSYIDFNKNAELKLIIKGEDNRIINSFELIEFNADFALNAIPTCTCLVSTGRSANSVDEVAEIHKFTNKNYQLLPAEVVLRLRNKKITLFDGYLTAISPHRSNNRFSVAVHLVHWLKDLDSFNLITNLTHMSHPFDLGNLLFFPLPLGSPATFGLNLSGNNNPGAGLLSFIDLVIWISRTSDEKLDLWKFIKNFFLTLADEKTFMNFSCMSYGRNRQQPPTPPQQQPSKTLLFTSNEEIKKALKRVGNEKIYTINSKVAKLYKKIVLKNPSLENLVYGGLKTFIAAQQTSNLSNNTVWAKLIGELFPLLFLNMIPTCSDATVSVVLPYYKPNNNNLMVIGTEDYHSIQTVSSFHHPLKGVFVIPPGQHVLTFGGAVTQTYGGDQGPYSNFICYINDKIGEKGSYIIVKSPPIVSLTDLHNLNDQVIDFIQLYAKQLYFTEVLKEHSATVSLPFRYDIAPGSLVVVEGAGEKFIKKDKMVYDIIGLVVKVSLTLNASEAAANTNIMLSYVRDAKDDSFYLSEHPLFDIESIPNGDGKEGGYAHWLPLATEE
jgi:hypothetical protein